MSTAKRVAGELKACQREPRSDLDEPHPRYDDPDPEGTAGCDVLAEQRHGHQGQDRRRGAGDRIHERQVPVLERATQPIGVDAVGQAAQGEPLPEPRWQRRVVDEWEDAGAENECHASLEQVEAEGVPARLDRRAPHCVEQRGEEHERDLDGGHGGSCTGGTRWSAVCTELSSTGRGRCGTR